MIYRFKKSCFDEEKETLKSSYERLNQEIVKLLQDNWQDIYGRKWVLRKQLPNGSRHNRKDLLSYLNGKNMIVICLLLSKKNMRI